MSLLIPFWQVRRLEDQIVPLQCLACSAQCSVHPLQHFGSGTWARPGDTDPGGYFPGPQETPLMMKDHFPMLRELGTRFVAGWTERYAWALKHREISGLGSSLRKVGDWVGLWVKLLQRHSSVPPTVPSYSPGLLILGAPSIGTSLSVSVLARPLESFSPPHKT